MPSYRQAASWSLALYVCLEGQIVIVSTHPRLVWTIHLRIRNLFIGAILVVVGVVSIEPLMKAWKDPAATDILAFRETEPVLSEGDAADDPAIFVNTAHPELSLILGTDKDDGLAVYDLDGRRIQYFDSGKFNNVDVRTEVWIAGRISSVAAACDTEREEIALFLIDAEQRRLTELPPRFEVSVDPSGLCLYRGEGGRLFVFVSGYDREQHEEDWIEQWEVTWTPDGQPRPQRVRRIRVQSACEGMVADDRQGLIFVAEENVGIWLFGAEPDEGDRGRLIQLTEPNGHLFNDVEGLALVDGQEGGYLIASSQGSDDFVVLRRSDDYRYVGRFEITRGRGIDGVSHTDGIDVTSAFLGEHFPGGVFVAQDDENGSSNQNFKLVSWAEVMSGLGLQ